MKQHQHLCPSRASPVLTGAKQPDPSPRECSPSTSSLLAEFGCAVKQQGQPQQDWEHRVTLLQAQILLCLYHLWWHWTREERTSPTRQRLTTLFHTGPEGAWTMNRKGADFYREFCSQFWFLNKPICQLVEFLPACLYSWTFSFLLFPSAILTNSLYVSQDICCQSLLSACLDAYLGQLQAEAPNF